MAMAPDVELPVPQTVPLLSCLAISPAAKFLRSDVCTVLAELATASDMTAFRAYNSGARMGRVRNISAPNPIPVCCPLIPMSAILFINKLSIICAQPML